MKTDELRARAEALAAEIDELSKLDNPTEEQTARFDAALAEVDPLAEEIREAEAAEAEKRAYDEKVEQIRAFASKPAHVQHGDGARTAPVPGASTRNIWDMEEARTAARDEKSFYAELRSRAATAIEHNDADSDEKREQQTRLLERGVYGDPSGGAVARHWLQFGNPTYRANWEKALRGDMVAINECTQATQRASWAEGTTTTGGFAVVADYDLTLLLVNAGSTNPFRQISRVVQTNSNTWKGLTTAGVTAGWITESTEEGNDTPAIAQPSVTIHRAGAYLQASFEVVADSNLGNEVGMLLADAKDTLEATAFATGTGGGQPYGVVTRCQSLNAYVFGDSGSTVEKDIVVSDIYALDNALSPRYRSNASFVANKAIWNQVRQLSTSAAGTFWVDFGGGVPSQLIGYPVYESSAMDSTVVSGSQDDVILLGDFRNGYIICDRIGMTMAYNPLVVGGTANIPTGEVGWFMYWRVGADVIDQTNAAHFKLLHK